ncbi:L,D-transpeptidase family protein [Paracoccus saliphilus]|uniref:L,D-transpeptidase catalytic domain n=1 Tax=Paracoccus saliphilus TaxID=405559 RepID=A0AA45W0L4_9RHOB|nr:L,D-transpeptidase family protein [Paracoccus saliphilus]WCR03231.1 L,D-transpeptidase family protein [Paracoccus saliphilus]SIS49990.1 L,D-transpeptidase catalytic domain [Paracoccus saliphilus]
MSPQDLVLTPQGIRFLGRVFPCSIGKTGVTMDKHEGDKATPSGMHRITGLWYRPDRLARPAPWARPIGPGDLWCDDPGHPVYNHHARVPLTASHECLRRPDPLYDLILTTDWNSPEAIPGWGSAIFLHQWRRPRFGTEGCIAFARPHLIWIARHATPGTRLIVPASLPGAQRVRQP